MSFSRRTLKLPGVKKPAALAVLGTAALVARRYMGARDAMAAVSQELRRPFLPFFPQSYSPLTLPFWRLPSTKAAGPDLTVTTRNIGDHGARTFFTTPVDRTTPRSAVLWIHGARRLHGGAVMDAHERRRAGY
jgi:hypothetical protein